MQEDQGGAPSRRSADRSGGGHDRRETEGARGGPHGRTGGREVRGPFASARQLPHGSAAHRRRPRRRDGGLPGHLHGGLRVPARGGRSGGGGGGARRADEGPRGSLRPVRPAGVRRLRTSPSHVTHARRSAKPARYTCSDVESDDLTRPEGVYAKRDAVHIVDV